MSWLSALGSYGTGVGATASNLAGQYLEGYGQMLGSAADALNQAGFTGAGQMVGQGGDVLSSAGTLLGQPQGLFSEPTLDSIVSSVTEYINPTPPGGPMPHRSAQPLNQLVLRQIQQSTGLTGPLPDYLRILRGY